jgi:hypothetical protein
MVYTVRNLALWSRNVAIDVLLSSNFGVVFYSIVFPFPQVRHNYKAISLPIGKTQRMFAVPLFFELLCLSEEDGDSLEDRDSER